MKFTALFILIATLHVSAKGFSQQVSLSEKNAKLEKVFKKIKQQTGYVFFYDQTLLQQAKTVTIDVKDVPLTTALNICFQDQPLTYTIVGSNIVVIEKPSLSLITDHSPLTDLPSLIDVSGKVTDPDGNPLAGANVKVKGTNHGATTNDDGTFILKGVDQNAVLEISFVGYQPVTVSLDNRTAINISLKLNITTNPEVIVRKGYYTEKKATTTGDVSTVTAKDLEKQPVNNPLLALQGRVPGVVMSQSNGLPGSGISIRIRGRNSMTHGFDPLYVIDGVPYPAANLPSANGFLLGTSGTSGEYTKGNPFSYLNPADIESIDILKDADATAIYGTRGANGVVLITTKKGKQGKMRADISVQSGFGKVAHMLDLLNTQQYLEMRREAFRNDGSIPNPNADFDLTFWDTTRYTNWQKELIGGTSHYNQAQIAFSGGAQNIQYRIAGTYHKETTVFPADFNDQKASVQFNVNGTSPNQKFNVILSGLYTLDDNKLPASDLTSLAVTLPPDAPPVYKPDGSINWQPGPTGLGTWSSGVQPASMMMVSYKDKTNNLLADLTISFKPFENFEIQSRFGYNTINSNSIQKNPLSRFDPYLWSTYKRLTGFSNSSINSWVIEPQASYSRNLFKGNVSVLLGASFQKNKSISQSIDASGFNNDQVMEDLGSATSIFAFPGINRLYKYNGLYARINYNRGDKYIVNLTGSRDGSSRFGPANQFHNFGSIGAAWVFSKEKSVQRILPILSFGKISASYGSTGSDQVGDYTFMDIYSGNSVGVPYQGIQGIAPDRIFTPDLAWEETRKAKLGLDLGFFNDRLAIGASYYLNRSSNQLLAYSLPSITGFTSVAKNFNAVVQNSGLELEIRSVNINTKNIQWATYLNVSANRNKLLSVANEIYPVWENRIGQPLDIFFAYRYAGVDFITGQYQFLDAKGMLTKTPTAADATAIVEFTPKFTGGLQNTLTYKGFQLDFLFQFIYSVNGNSYRQNYLPGFFSSSFGYNQPVTVLNRWRRPGDVADIQRFSQNSSTVNGYKYLVDSDHAFEDASYIRLRNASLTWQLPNKWQKAAHLQNTRLFVLGQNLLTFTKYSGLDPETRTSTSLPVLRVITFGFQTTL